MKKSSIALILLVVALLIVVPVYAQETTPEATGQATEVRPVAGVAETVEPEIASGLTSGILLLGLLAVAVVGGLSLMRERYKAPQE